MISGGLGDGIRMVWWFVGCAWGAVGRIGLSGWCINFLPRLEIKNWSLLLHLR